MPREAKYDVLFEPVRVGPKVMKNRFYATPHATNFGVDFPYSQAAYREMRAEGGFAVVNTEYVAVHEQSDDYPWVQARLIDDDDVRAMSLLCDRIHAHDALASIELNFLGPDHTAFGSRLPARGVSQLEGGLWAASSSCYEMSKSDIKALELSYAETAKRALRAGFRFRQRRGSRDGIDHPALPLALLEQAHRRVRRVIREPGSILAGNVGAGPRRYRRLGRRDSSVLR